MEKTLITIAIATDTDNTATTTFVQTHQELDFEKSVKRSKILPPPHKVYMQEKDERGTKQLQIFKALMAGS
jgi:hypothetical protein